MGPATQLVSWIQSAQLGTVSYDSRQALQASDGETHTWCCRRAVITSFSLQGPPVQHSCTPTTQHRATSHPTPRHCYRVPLSRRSPQHCLSTTISTPASPGAGCEQLAPHPLRLHVPSVMCRAPLCTVASSSSACKISCHVHPAPAHGAFHNYKSRVYQYGQSSAAQAHRKSRGVHSHLPGVRCLFIPV